MTCRACSEGQGKKDAAILINSRAECCYGIDKEGNFRTVLPEHTVASSWWTRNSDVCSATLYFRLYRKYQDTSGWETVQRQGFRKRSECKGQLRANHQTSSYTGGQQAETLSSEVLTSTSVCWLSLRPVKNRLENSKKSHHRRHPPGKTHDFHRVMYC